MDYKLSPQSLDEVQDFLDGRKTYTETKVSVDAAFRLADALRRRLCDELSKTSSSLSRAEHRLDRIDTRKEAEIKAGNFEELGFTAADIAKCVLYTAGQMPCDRLILIITAVYFTWLASKNERITLEHPVAWPLGPMFVKVFHDIKKHPYTTEDAAAGWKELAGKNPGLAATIRNTALKYKDVELKNLRSFFTQAGSPWYKASVRNGGPSKWNTELNDIDIWQWKHAQKMQ